MAKATSKTLEELHEALARFFLERIRAGDAPANLAKEAREFLKDNGIEVSRTHEDETLQELADVLPFPGEEVG